ncbi:MAG TPA: hypothetical protein VLK88_05765, partial [Gemmatimonadales bacterium]|nr:hypothetical protein [Gemmatimonadales bacterium]
FSLKKIVPTGNLKGIDTKRVKNTDKITSLYLHRNQPTHLTSDHGDEDFPAPFDAYTAEPFGDLRLCGGIAELVEQLGDDWGIGRFSGADHRGPKT